MIRVIDEINENKEIKNKIKDRLVSNAKKKIVKEVYEFCITQTGKPGELYINTSMRNVWVILYR